MKTPALQQTPSGGSDHRLVVRSSTAWDAIGWDEGLFRIKGGRTTYEAVMYNCANNGDKVKLAKLVPANGGIREVSRYVDPDTVLEFLSSHNVKCGGTAAQDSQSEANEGACPPLPLTTCSAVIVLFGDLTKAHRS